MSGPSMVTPEAQIIAAILGDAETQVRALVTQAEDAAKTELDDARRAADAAADAIRALAERDAARLCAKTIAGARVEARRSLLRAREDAVGIVLAEIEKSLNALRADPLRYRAALQSLLTEAAVGVGAERVVVTLSADDKPIIDDSLLASVREALRAARNRDVSIEVRFDSNDLGGGCVATDEDGRVFLDNTLPRRLLEARKQLKSMIMAEMAQS